MKQKDIALIIVIAFMSAIVSFVVSNKLFVTPKTKNQQVEVVDPISPTFTTPDKKYFNENSVDPAPSSQLDTGSQDPFNGTSQ